MDAVSSKFFELLGIAQNHSDPEALGAMTDDRWEILFNYAKKQTLSGIVFPALDMMPHDNKAPLRLYARWALLYERIKELNKKQLDHCRDLTRIFADAGFRTCVLKGQSLAAYYPDPSQRQPGDIDIWVDAPMDKVLEFLKSRWKVNLVVYHHCDVKIFDDAEVEVHFRPAWFNSFRYDKVLQNYFESVSNAQFANFNADLGFSMPTAEFNAVYILVHIMRHLLDEGVGFRQLMDYSMVLEKLDGQGRAGAMEIIGKLNLVDFCAAVMYVLRETFHTSKEKLLVAPDSVKGEFLLREIITSGNFGKSDSRNIHSASEGRVGRALRKWKRALGLSSLLSTEVLCQPSFKLWQFLWRARKDFL